MDADKEVVQPPKAAEEIASAERQERTVLKADALLMRSLMAHPGWKRYLTMIEAVSQNFMQQVMAPCDNVNETLKPERAKGTLLGLSTAAQLPAAKIREAVAAVGSGFLDAE